MRARHREGLTALAFLVLAFLAAPCHAAEGLEFIPPEGCLPGDGGPAFWIHIFVWGTGGKEGTLKLRTDLGSLDAPESLGLGLFRTRFHPPELSQPREATWTGEWSDGSRLVVRGVLQPKLCPHPTGLVEVRAEPDRLLAEEDRQAVIHIRAADEEGHPTPGLPLEVTANVGTLGNLKDVGGGEYQVVFQAPDERFPQVAIIMVANPTSARLDRVAAGRAVIPIAARLDLPGKTSPSVNMEVEIASHKFGPVTADGKGQFQLHILVPPGHGRALATSIDRVGNKESRWIDLFLPETNQLGLWAYPREVPADGFSKARLLVTTIDPFGAPTDIGGVHVHARAGAIGEIKRMGQGLFEAYYTSPPGVGSGSDSLEVTFPGGGKKSKAAVEIRLRPGPADTAEISAPEVLPADGASEGTLTVLVKDQRGNPVDNELVSLAATSGRIGTVRQTAIGQYQAGLLVDPDPAHWIAEVIAEVRDRGGSEPTRLLAAAESLKNSSTGNSLEVVLADRDGLPVPHQTVAMKYCGPIQTRDTDDFGRARFSLEFATSELPQHCALEAKAGIIHRRLHLFREGGQIRLLPIDLESDLPTDSPIQAKAKVRIYPPTAVNVALEAAPAPAPGKPWLLRARVTGRTGEPMRGLTVVFATSAGALSPPKEVSPGVFEAELVLPGGIRSATVSAIESKSRVGAVLDVGPSGGAH